MYLKYFMHIEKTAQLNWFRGIKDRIRGNKPDESGQELSFNEQELRGLEEIERRKTEEEKQRVDKLVEESKKRTEEVGRFDNIPGKFELSRSGIEEVLSMDNNTLWHKLCASFENCSPYVSQETAERGRLIRNIVEGRFSYPLGWGSMLRSISFLFEGLELDLKNMHSDNIVKKSSFQLMKPYFTHSGWLSNNKQKIQEAYNNIKNDKSIFKDVLDNQDYYENTMIKIWVHWWKNFTASPLDDNFFPYVIMNRDELWQRFEEYVDQSRGPMLQTIGVELSKRYLPENMRTHSDGVHTIDISFFNTVPFIDTRDVNNPIRKWSIDKWKNFLQDLKIMFDISGLEMNGKSSATNIRKKNVYFNMMQKIIMIQNIIYRDYVIKKIFTPTSNTSGVLNSIHEEVVKEFTEYGAEKKMQFLASAVQQIAMNRYGGYNREIEDASDSSMLDISWNMPEEAQNILLHLEYGQDSYDVKRDFEKYMSLRKKYQELHYNVLENVKEVIKNPDFPLMSPEEQREYTTKQLAKINGREFDAEKSKKAKEEQILDSPFEHTSTIAPHHFPGQGRFSNVSAFPKLKGTPVSFHVAIYPKKKDNDPEKFTEIFKPSPRDDLSRDGVNWHHRDIKELEKDDHFKHMLGWVGGWIDVVGKNLYVVELQSDIMQNTGYMKDPEKSKAKLNEELNKLSQELQKEKENLAKQSSAGTDAYYDKRIKELEDKKNAANNEALKQQMNAAINKLIEQKNAKEDPWSKIRKKITDIESVIAQVNEQLKEVLEYEKETKNLWRRRPQFADVKSKIENRFSEYIDVFYNEMFYYCDQLKINNLWIIDADHLYDVWTGLVGPETRDLYERVYNNKAEELGAEKQGNWWHLDLTKKMPKYAITNWYQRTKNGMV